MDCIQIGRPDNREYLARFNARVARRRIPLSGSMDLTHRCNLNCIHCYLSDADKGPPDAGRELDARRWCRIVDDIADAGCLYLLLTGGEPLLHSGFSQIYTHAKQRGMLVTVFTNGTRLDARWVDLFRRLPPHAVEISLYGATRETYAAVTGARGALDRCLRGIRLLKDQGIRVRLKTVLMTVNRHELSEMQRMAQGLDAPFRFDAAVFPRFNGDRSPAALRVDPGEAVALEMSDPKRLEDWRDLYRRMGERSDSDRLYTCGAGRTTFHIDPYGTLRPCLMARHPTHDLTTGSLAAGWQTVMAGLLEKRLDAGAPCAGCDKRVLCGFCPPFFELENGAEDRYSSFLCEMGRHRLRWVRQTGIRCGPVAGPRPGGPQAPNGV